LVDGAVNWPTMDERFTSCYAAYGNCRGEKDRNIKRGNRDSGAVEKPVFSRLLGRESDLSGFMVQFVRRSDEEERLSLETTKTPFSLEPLP